MQEAADDFRVLCGQVYRPKGRQAQWAIFGVPKLPPHRLQQLQRELARLCRVTGLNIHIVRMGQYCWVAHATMGRRGYCSDDCCSPYRAMRLLRCNLRQDFRV